MIKTDFFSPLLILIGLLSIPVSCGQKTGDGQLTTDANTPLHLLKPDYPVVYGETTAAAVKAVIDRVHGYLEEVTPASLVNKNTNAKLDDLAAIDTNTIFERGDFRLISYEWGVTYGAMLLASQATGDDRFQDYTKKRIDFIAEVVAVCRNLETQYPGFRSAVYSVTHLAALDDAGAMCAAIIKAMDAGILEKDVRPMIDGYIGYILNKEFRLEDGTLARNRPLPNTLWLDDLYMSLPALVQMGRFTKEERYLNEALRQYWLFADRMFNAEKGIYMHGWVQDMQPHPAFYWARANGWALLTKVEILNTMPDNHPEKAKLLEQFKKHVHGLAPLQHGTGFWHQLLDRHDTYLETSATAIYAYCIAHGINKGWLDMKAYGPMVLQAWNAVSSKVNAEGQVEGTCVGTGMGFDPAFYYYRPVNKYAAHGYGPVLLAGAEVYRMLTDFEYEINDSAVQFIGRK